MELELRNEDKNLTDIELALKTWYRPNDPLYKNPTHPTIKLAGEIGELLDLYGKHKYKPNFNWMQCKWCKELLGKHFENNKCDFQKSLIAPSYYLPMVIDELGDIWYYLRILAWINDYIFEIPIDYNLDDITLIKRMYQTSAKMLDENEAKNIVILRLQVIYNCLFSLLIYLDYTLDDLTLINYQKLVLDKTNHGWWKLDEIK